MRRQRALIAGLVGLAGLVPSSAGAERPLYAAADAGGYVAVTGPQSSGWTASGHLFPGGRLGRYGARAQWRSLDDTPGLLTAGLAFEAGAARPRLQVSLHADAGATLESPRPVAGGGIRAAVWIVGPIFVAIDGGGLLFYDGIDSSLALATSLSLGVGNPGGPH